MMFFGHPIKLSLLTTLWSLVFGMRFGGQPMVSCGFIMKFDGYTIKFYGHPIKFDSNPVKVSNHLWCLGDPLKLGGYPMKNQW